MVNDVSVRDKKAANPRSTQSKAQACRSNDGHHYRLADGGGHDGRLYRDKSAQYPQAGSLSCPQCQWDSGDQREKHSPHSPLYVLQFGEGEGALGAPAQVLAHLP